MTHDTLCPMWSKVIAGDVCDCDLIAQVRQDERINSLGTRVRELKPYANGYCDGERDMLAKCIATLDERIPLVADNGSWESSIAAAWLRAAITDLQRLEAKI